MFADSNTKLVLTELMLQETGTFKEQFIRPYTAVCHADKMDDLASRVEQLNHQSPGMMMEPSSVVGLTSGIIRPAVEVEKSINIMNGWQERRFRFTLVVEEQSSLGSTIYHYQGFSEYFSVSMSGHIDPNMVFFLNSYIKINRTMNPMIPGQYVDRIVESKSITNGRLVSDGTTDLFGIRSQDLYAGIQSNFIASAGGGYAGVVETRNPLQNSVFSTRRKTAIPSFYLSNLVDDYRSAQAQADYGQGTANVYDRAISLSYEANPFENMFIRHLTTNRGMQLPVSDFSITELLRMDPTFASRIHYQPVEDLGYLSDYRGDHCDWNARNIETEIAVILSKAVPALMLDCGLVTAHFTATNMTINGETQTNHLAPGQTVSTDNPMRHHNYFVQRFNTEIFPDLTHLGRLAVSVSVSADVYNEIQIQIQVENNHGVTFRYPCFCDSLLQPTMTVDKANYNNMVAGTEDILNVCGIKPGYDGAFAGLFDGSQIQNV